MEEAKPAGPQVTVVIVSRNQAPLLRRCLQALESSHSRETFDVVVVDNGSQDESPGLDADFPAARLLRLPRNFGFVKALNIGLRSVTADLAFILSPEIEVRPDTINLLAARMESQPDAVAICPLLLKPDGSATPPTGPLPHPGRLRSSWESLDQPAGPSVDLAQDLAPAGCASLAAMMIRTYFVKGLRYLDERFGEYGPEPELALQIARASRRIYVATQARAVRAPREAGAPLAPGTRALLAADRAHGTAVLLGKHFGSTAGLAFKARVVAAAAGNALLSLVTFRDTAYRWKLLSLLLSGQKIDGSQRDF
jgi:hypothetical protein